MKLIILLILLIFSSLMAENNLSSSVSIKTSFAKTSRNTNLQEVLKQKFIPSKTTNFGFYDGAIWEKIELSNLENSSKTLYATTFRTTLDYVDAYITDNNSIIASYLLGDMREIENSETRIFNFPIQLNSNQNLTIYIKHQNYRGVIEANWNFLDQISMKYLIFYDSLFFGVYIGLTFLVAMQSIFVYFVIKKKFLLFYAFAVIFMVSSQMFFNGFINHFNILPVKFVSYPEITFYLALIFVILFHYEFFEVKYENRWLKRYIKALVVPPIILVVSSLLLEDNVSCLLKISVLTHWIIISSLIIIGIKMSLKGVSGGWFYVIGQSITFASTILIFGFLFISNSSLPIYFNYLMPICTLLNILFLLFALYVRLKKQHNEFLKKTLAMYNLSRFDSTGMEIHNIIHQWKIPLSRMTAIITELETKSHFNQSIEKDLLEYFPQIKKNTMDMSEIVSEFYKFNTKSIISTCSYSNEIFEIKQMLSHKINLVSADIEFKCFIENDLIKTDKFVIFNISTIIINNFLDIAQRRGIKKPRLVISMKKNNNQICIEFQDNCKGIDIFPIEMIFEPFQTMSDNSSKGLGLYIAKTLAEEKLQGKLTAENAKNGAIFKLKLNYHNLN